MPKTLLQKKSKTSQKVSSILKVLDSLYPNLHTELIHQTTFQLLIATMMSAQCTDRQVNIVTPQLFAKFPDVQSLASAKVKEIESLIRSTGFYHNKAKNILATSKMILKEFKGQVPDNLDDLLKLPGVGRKTANVILGASFGIPAVVVDTHVKRICYRLGFTQSTDPDKIEQDIAEKLPPDSWNQFSLQLIQLGRKICTSRKAHCEVCPLLKLCDYGINQEEK